MARPHGSTTHGCLVMTGQVVTITVAICMSLASATSRAQDRDTGAGLPRKQAIAVRVADGAIDLDGRLEEDVWRTAPPTTDFVQKEPIEGAPPAERMEVRFAYDGSAFHVGARMFSSSPSAIQAPMGRRDDVEAQAENIMVALDTFLDRRTAYVFGVSASGVRLDRFHARDDEETFDPGWDPVWRVKTHIDELGWTAEMWIPFTQLGPSRWRGGRSA